MKVVDPQTGEPLPPNIEGLLLVKGPNRMLGYLGNPELTNSVLRDGWYVTGDIASVDDEGFIRITDRLSRFSKIGGEMVPHLRIEVAVADIVGGPDMCGDGRARRTSRRATGLLYTDEPSRRGNCGSASRKRTFRRFGFRSARTCFRCRTCLFSARESSTCAPYGRRLSV